MIVVDVNVLVYAGARGLPQHDAARDWLDEQLNGSGRVGLPWSSLFGYLRLITNRRVMRRPAGSEAAWSQVQDWLDRPASWVPVPGPRHRAIVTELVAAVRPTADLVPDVALAALAIEHGVGVASTDSDFARFPGLRWVNPLTVTRA